jgi:hypothetical protein|uniref:RNaseLS-like protein n=1 Tax=Siphoviridae sp. ctLNL10 TaxID=2825453 RepID=A0A8S5Q396_9CAUD|nr:MAG TPA: RNaseLS-like protein [Siphoviridae sp. ctLNL10]
MVKDNKYKGLSIDLNNIQGWANAFCSINDLQLISMDAQGNAQVKNYIFKVKDFTFGVDFFVSKGNRYTISYKRGTRQDVSQMFADFILERIGTVNVTDANKGFTIQIEHEDFEAFIDLLVDDDVQVQDKKEDSKEIVLRIKSMEYGDTITVHYYKNTHNLFIQGRRLQLFEKAVEILSGKCPLDEVVAAEIRYAKVAISPQEMLREMEDALEGAYSFISTTQKAIFASAFVFYRVDIDMPDYSMYIQAMCRGMEGYMLKLLAFNNVVNEDDNTLGYFFYNDEHNSHPLELQAQYASKIDNDNVTNEINKLYKWWHKNRHQYSHANERDDTTAIIKDRKIADAIFKEAVNLISSSYKNIVSAKKES